MSCLQHSGTVFSVVADSKAVKILHCIDSYGVILPVPDIALLSLSWEKHFTVIYTILSFFLVHSFLIFKNKFTLGKKLNNSYLGNTKSK